MRTTIYTLLLAMLVSIRSFGQELIFNEENGFVIFEAEETTSNLDKWVKKTDNPGYMGECHLEFTGNSINGGAATSSLEYTIKINNPGNYGLVIRARKRLDGAEWDKCNDGYVRLDGDYSSGNSTPTTVLKSSTKLFGGPETGWGWATTLDKDHVKYTPVYYLKAGTYKFVLSGRSIRWNVDRIAFFNKSMGLSAPSQTAPATEILGKCDEPGCYDHYTVQISEPTDSFSVFNDESFTIKTAIGGTGLGLGGITYYIDDEIAAETNGSPYRYTFNASQFTVGDHKAWVKLKSAEGKEFLSDTIGFTTLDASGKIYQRECEDYEEFEGLRRIGSKDNSDCLSYADSSDWVTYQVFAPKSGTYGFVIRHATLIEASKIKIYIDGELTNTLTPAVTGGYQNWEDSHEINIDLQQGDQELKLVYGGPDSNKYLSNLNWFKYWYKYPTSVKSHETSAAFRVVSHQNNITVYPNYNSEYYNLNVYSINGGLIKSCGNTTGVKTLHIPNAKGIYIVSIRNKQGISSQKVIF